MGKHRGALAWILCAALACGGPPAPVVPAPRVPWTKHYQPLAMKADSKLAGQAVILGTDQTGGSTLLPLPSAPSSAVVDAMFVDPSGAAPASAVVIAVTLTTSANVASVPDASRVPGAANAATAPAASQAPPTSKGPAASPLTGAPDPAIHAPDTAPSSLQIDGSDEHAEASWQAGLWSSALVAATALGKDVADVTFSAVPPVPGDRAPASALIAGGFLATMTGEPVDPAATVTGMIHPDGTIGPVAGIPEQFRAAIARGKTRLGYPSGMRVARSLASGKDVDLVRLAGDHHAEATELASVHDAYQLLTRKALPASLAVNEADMALDRETLDGLRGEYLAWQKRLAGQWAELLQLEQSGRLPAAVTLAVRFAHEHSAQAEALHRTGKLPSAYGHMLGAWVFAAGANATHVVLAKLQAGDVDGAVAALTALDTTEPGVGALLERIGALRPSALAGHLAMIAAFQAALRSWSHRALATESIRATTQFLAAFKGKSAGELGSPATADAVANTVVPTALLLFRTTGEAALAEAELALEPDRGVAYACTPADVKRLAAAFQGASAAGLRYAEALLVQPLARSAGITDDAARRGTAAREPDLVIANMVSRGTVDGLPHALSTSWGDDSAAASLLLLASHQLAHHSAALLIAKYGSLGVHVDDTGRIDALAHPALRSLISNAKLAARAAAHAARIATGEIPVHAKLVYQLATVEESGSLDDQLDALSELWTATAFSQLAVALARN